MNLRMINETPCIVVVFGCMVVVCECACVLLNVLRLIKHLLVVLVIQLQRSAWTVQGVSLDPRQIDLTVSFGPRQINLGVLFAHTQINLTVSFSPRQIILMVAIIRRRL